MNLELLAYMIFASVLAFIHLVKLANIYHALHVSFGMCPMRIISHFAKGLRLITKMSSWDKSPWILANHFHLPICA